MKKLKLRLNNLEWWIWKDKIKVYGSNDEYLKYLHNRWNFLLIYDDVYREIFKRSRLDFDNEKKEIEIQDDSYALYKESISTGLEISEVIRYYFEFDIYGGDSHLNFLSIA